VGFEWILIALGTYFDGGGAETFNRCNHRKALSQNKFENKKALQRPNLPLHPPRTSPHLRRAWDLREGGAGGLYGFRLHWARVSTVAAQERSDDTIIEKRN